MGIENVAYLQSAAPLLETLIQLERRALACATPAALGFTIVNETSALSPYGQAAFFECRDFSSSLSLTHASGLVSVSADTPFAVWLSQVARQVAPQPAVQSLSIESVPAHLVDGWLEWLPEHVLACNVYGIGGERIGLALYAREQAWREVDTSFFRRIHEVYGYCLQALSRTPRSLAAIAAQLLERRWLRRIAIAAAVVLLIPVRLSAVAPAEVVALSAIAIAAPQDGVVGTFYVQPNSQVKAGDRLFSLDERGLESRRAVAQQALQIARADLLSAQQRAFDDMKSKGELAAAQGRVKEKEAELEMIEGTPCALPRHPAPMPSDASRAREPGSA